MWALESMFSVCSPGIYMAYFFTSVRSLAECPLRTSFPWPRSMKQDSPHPSRPSYFPYTFFMYFHGLYPHPILIYMLADWLTSYLQFKLTERARTLFYSWFHAFLEPRTVAWHAVGIQRIFKKGKLNEMFIKFLLLFPMAMEMAKM